MPCPPPSHSLDEGDILQPRSITVAAYALFCVIAVLPMGFMAADSLVRDGALSLAPYVAVFSESRQVALFFKTLAVALGATLSALAVGVPLAFLLGRSDLPFRKIGHRLCLVPLLIPPYIHALAWIYLMGDRGVLNRIFMTVFRVDSPLLNIYGPGGAVFVLCLSYFPLVTLLTRSGLDSVDRRMEEAAALHAPAITALRKITVPLVIPQILSGAVFVFIFSLFDYGVPSLLRVQTYPVEIFAQFSAFYNERQATAMALPLVVTALALLFLQRRLMGTRGYVALDTGRRPAATIPLHHWKAPCALFVFSVLTLSVFLPLGILLAQAGSMESYRTAIQTSYREMVTSLWTAGASATLVTGLSLLVSLPLEGNTGKGRNALDILSYLPFAFPATALGIGLIRVWNRSATEWIYGSGLILVIAYSARAIPFSVRVVTSNMKQVSRSIGEAALLAERRWLRRLRGIDLPLLAPGLATSWVVAFVIGMGELGATLLVVPPGNGTLSLKIYTLLHYGAYPLVAALAVIVVGLMFLCTLPVLLLSRRWPRFRAAAGPDGGNPS